MKRKAETQIETTLAKKTKNCETLDDIQALCNACLNDNENEINDLLQRITFNTRNTNGFNALHLIGMQGSLEECKNVTIKYIKYPTYINYIASGATHGGQKGILDFLLELTQSKNIILNYNKIAAAAAQGGQKEILVILLEHMKNNNITPDYNRILQSGAIDGRHEVIQYIVGLMKNTNESITYRTLKKVLKYIYSQYVNQSFFADVINLSADVNHHPANRPSLFFLAVTYQMTEAVEILLDKGANINDTFNNRHVVAVATANKHLPILTLLLQDKNYSIAHEAATSQSLIQAKVVEGIMGAKFINAGHPAAAKDVENIVYNADNVLLWLNKIKAESDSTLHTAFAQDEDKDVLVSTIIECIKQNHIQNVANKCGL